MVNLINFILSDENWILLIAGSYGTFILYMHIWVDHLLKKWRNKL